MKTEHANLGVALKQRREEMNLSLKEAETATSIRMAYLQAIEEGNINKLPSPVYAQGFVKQYANYLGMDGENVVKDNPTYFQKPEQQEFSYGIGTLEMRGSPGGGVRWLPNVVWIVIFVLMLAFAWYLARYLEVL